MQKMIQSENLTENKQFIMSQTSSGEKSSANVSDSDSVPEEEH